MMQFKVTAKHIRQQNTKSALVALFLVALSLGCVLAIVHAKSWVSMIFPLIGILTFSSAILSEYKIIKEGVAAYPILDFDKFAGKINVSLNISQNIQYIYLNVLKLLSKLTI